MVYLSGESIETAASLQLVHRISSLKPMPAVDVAHFVVGSKLVSRRVWFNTKTDINWLIVSKLSQRLSQNLTSRSFVTQLPRNPPFDGLIMAEVCWGTPFLLLSVFLVESCWILIFGLWNLPCFVWNHNIFVNPRIWLIRLLKSSMSSGYLLLLVLDGCFSELGDLFSSASPSKITKSWVNYESPQPWEPLMFKPNHHNS